MTEKEFQEKIQRIEWTGAQRRVIRQRLQAVTDPFAEEIRHAEAKPSRQGIRMRYIGAFAAFAVTIGTAVFLLLQTPTPVPDAGANKTAENSSVSQTDNTDSQTQKPVNPSFIKEIAPAVFQAAPTGETDTPSLSRTPFLPNSTESHIVPVKNGWYTLMYGNGQLSYADRTEDTVSEIKVGDAYQNQYAILDIVSYHDTIYAIANRGGRYDANAVVLLEIPYDGEEKEIAVLEDRQQASSGTIIHHQGAFWVSLSLDDIWAGYIEHGQATEWNRQLGYSLLHYDCATHEVTTLLHDLHDSTVDGLLEITKPEHLYGDGEYVYFSKKSGDWREAFKAHGLFRISVRTGAIEQILLNIGDVEDFCVCDDKLLCCKYDSTRNGNCIMQYDLKTGVKSYFTEHFYHQCKCTKDMVVLSYTNDGNSIADIYGWDGELVQSVPLCVDEAPTRYGAAFDDTFLYRIFYNATEYAPLTEVLAGNAVKWKAFPMPES